MTLAPSPCECRYVTVWPGAPVRNSISPNGARSPRQSSRISRALAANDSLRGNIARADNPFVRRVAAQLPGHDDREQFLAGVNLILAGIAAVRDVS